MLDEISNHHPARPGAPRIDGQSTDEAFERLRGHLADDEIVAVMFHLACLDGFGKLDAVREPADDRPAVVSSSDTPTDTPA